MAPELETALALAEEELAGLHRQLASAERGLRLELGRSGRALRELAALRERQAAERQRTPLLEEALARAHSARLERERRNLEVE